MDAKAIQYTMGKSRKRETEERESEKPKERRALARCIRREMKKAHNKGCYGLILNMLLDWLAIR